MDESELRFVDNLLPLLYYKEEEGKKMKGGGGSATIAASSRSTIFPTCVKRGEKRGERVFTTRSNPYY